MSPGPIPEVPIWFPGARLNYAENLLWRNDDGIALIAGSERGHIERCSFRELRLKVREMAAAMRVNGVVAGDRVAGQLAQIRTSTVGLMTVFGQSHHHEFYHCGYHRSSHNQHRCNLLRNSHGYGPKCLSTFRMCVLSYLLIGLGFRGYSTDTSKYGPNLSFQRLKLNMVERNSTSSLKPLRS